MPDMVGRCYADASGRLFEQAFDDGDYRWVAEVVKNARRPILTVVGNHDGLIYGEEIYGNEYDEDGKPERRDPRKIADEPFKRIGDPSPERWSQQA